MSATAFAVGPASAGAFGPCSNVSGWQSLATGAYVRVAPEFGYALLPDAGSPYVNGGEGLFQSCAIGNGNLALYSDYDHLWIRTEWWTNPAGYLRALDSEVAGARDEYWIPRGFNYELAVSVFYANAGYGEAFLDATPFIKVVDPYNEYSAFNYGWLPSVACGC